MNPRLVGRSGKPYRRYEPGARDHLDPFQHESMPSPSTIPTMTGRAMMRATR